jgi:uncharacterized Zn-binding protein involved in type VI secretion
MGKPAARLGDLTSHGGTIVSGSANVFFNGMPAAYALSMHLCPMVTPGTPPLPHGGMNGVPTGALTVLVNSVPAMVLGDMFLCAGPPATVLLGSPTILIGMDGSCGGAGQGAMASAAAVGSSPHAPSAPPVSEPRAANSGEDHEASPHTQGSSPDPLTLKDFIEIFEAVERQQGYEAARHYASVGINYERLTELARAFVEGRDTNPDNDPQCMPTRFMLLYGGQDEKLRVVDLHPDSFENGPEHRITIANLRAGLRLLGATLAENGGYDEELLAAHGHYLHRMAACQVRPEGVHVVEPGESLGDIAVKYGLPSWKYLYQINAESIGDNPDLLAAGTQLQLPQWDSTAGDEMIRAKGADPSWYAHGLGYRYPWVPFSATIVNDQGDVLSRQDQQEALAYELRDAERGTLLASDTIARGDALELLIPDSRRLQISVDGSVCCREMKG